MQETHCLRFAPFRLDLGAEQLWHGEEARPLTRKAFAALRYLVGHVGQLVTKDELIAAVWTVPYISDMALAACIHEIRRALGEAAQTPQFLETVRGRGYRFRATVRVADQAPVPSVRGSLAPGAIPQSELLVGRAMEMAQLQQWWAYAQQGRRQIVLVTGEAGIGKTALVDAFVTQVATTANVWIGRGQCIEQYGAGEAYLPLLDALGHLGRSPVGTRLLELLRQQAPSWLLQLPALVPDAVYDTLQRRGEGVTRERMLRELAEAMEVLTAEQPLVLVLEDLHWSDVSTLEWLAYVARQPAAARLLILGTYRPVDAIVRAHPLRTVLRELQLHGHCVELALGYLSAAGVTTYLAQRFGTLTQSEGLAQVLHTRTSGNPLFLIAVVDALVRQGVMREGAEGWEVVGGLAAVQRGVPESLLTLLEQQFEQLPLADQRLLEVASVVGGEFATAAVAAGVDTALDVVETQCAALTRRGQFLQFRGTDTWPDGTVTDRYGFVHALYHEALYERIPASQRGRWHRQIGAWLEQASGSQARDMAAELAEHFVRGRDTGRAVQYLQYAGEQAVQRSAHQEALRQLTRGIELLATLPETPGRAQQELDLHIALGPALMAAKGWAVPEVEQTYARSRALCAQVGETPQLFPALMGLSRFYLTRGPLPTALELGQQLYRLAQDEDTLTHRLEAHKALGDTLFFLGAFPVARPHLAQGITLTDPTVERVQALRHGVAPGVRCRALMANTLWCLGAPEQALQQSQEALDLAQAVGHPQSLAMVHHFAALLYHRRREVPALQAQANALLTLATAHELPLWVGHGTCWQGWTLAVQGQEEAGTAQVRQGLAAVLATGQTLTRPFHLVLLAEAASRAGQVEAGLHLLAEALTAFEASGRADMLAEVYRLQGEFLLQQAVADSIQAEACFQQALAVARSQQAKSWELRAALSLSRLWQRQGKCAEAYQLLAKTYGWFTEGFDTADLQEARALLEALGGDGTPP